MTGRDEPTVLLVEDEEDLRSLLADELSEAGFCVRAADSAEQAVAALRATPVDAVLSDLRLPGDDGFALLKHASSLHPRPGFVVVTAYGTVARAVEALKAGADDFLTKPLDLEHLKLTLSRVLETRDLRLRLDRYRKTLEDDRFHGLIGQSSVMRRVVVQIRQVAQAEGPVLVTGESGTGKELVARAVHLESSRSTNAFLPVNCAGIPSELLETEFFGHVAGAFTGARQERKGLFVRAHGGTIFLDELSEMPLGLQAKLLRIIEDGRVRPVGADQEIKVDVRIIAASNEDLEQAVREGRFREDLFYRLETFNLHVPPLRDRGEDRDLLIGHFLNHYAMKMDRDVRGLSREAHRRLLDYPFAGNVRELRNALERAVVFCDGKEIQLAHLPSRIREYRSPTPPPTRDTAGLPDDWMESREIPPLREMERRYVRRVLKHVGGNKRRAASLLGIGRRTLYRYLESSGD